MTQTELAHFVRRRMSSHVHDETGAPALGTAIYTLSDPRELRVPRYVGQTRAPRRRFFQHVGGARLWMPDEVPWWIVDERRRPLYEWIRVLFRDERRLPVLVVTAWHAEATEATAGERDQIQEFLRQQMPLLNVACAMPQPQIRLF